MSRAFNSDITCPKCGEVIPLDETLAAPVIAQIRSEAASLVQKSRQEAEAKMAEATSLQVSLAQQAKTIADKEASIQAEVNKQLAAERLRITETERANILEELGPQLQADREKLQKAQEDLRAAQKAELELRQQRDALEQRAQALDLEVARKIDEQRAAIKEQAARDAEDGSKLKIAELQKTIGDMQIKLEEAQKKGSQGSQQLQGEVLELDFEAMLKQSFPQDDIVPVKTGQRGGDLLQNVLASMGGGASGIIFWETKRAASWSDQWVTKAKQDAVEAKAEVVVIVSEVLPKGIHDFGPYDGLWVTRPGFAVPLAAALRQGLIETATARKSAEGLGTKAEMLYSYLTGPEFRGRVEGIALPFREFHEELMAEKRTTLARWKRQEKRIDRVLNSVASLAGDLKGIGGAEMPALPGFEPETIEADEDL
jgi:hypothetical protein